jgi:hypothetical protein
MVTANITAAQTLTLAATPPVGVAITVTVFKSNSGDVTITVPNGTGFDPNNTNITAKGSSQIEFNILNNGTNVSIKQTV